MKPEDIVENIIGENENNDEPRQKYMHCNKCHMPTYHNRRGSRWTCQLCE